MSAWRIGPKHGALIRRQEFGRLQAGDVEVPEIDLGRYGDLVGARSTGPLAQIGSDNGSEALPAAGFSAGMPDEACRGRKLGSPL
jgi:hypothetical protein